MLISNVYEMGSTSRMGRAGIGEKCRVLDMENNPTFSLFAEAGQGAWVVLDVVAVDEQCKPSFQVLQHRYHSRAPNSHRYIFGIASRTEVVLVGPA